MEKQLKKLLRTLQVEFWIFITVAVVLCLCYELGWLPEGIYAGDSRLQYIWETAGVLATLAVVPSSLKLFSVLEKKKIASAPLPRAMRLYRIGSEVRLMLLAVVAYLNIFVYYSTLDNIGGLCALICITASVFCLPGEKKLKEELNLTDSWNE